VPERIDASSRHAVGIPETAQLAGLARESVGCLPYVATVRNGETAAAGAASRTPDVAERQARPPRAAAPGARRRHRAHSVRSIDANQASDRLALRIAAIALVTAFAIAVGDGGDSFWLCLPATLLVGALSPTRTEAIAGATAVVAAGLVPLAGWLNAQPVPSPVLTFLILAASLTVLIAVRERLEREHAALRNVALSDPLTGIANRRLLLSRAEYEIARHTRTGHSFTLVMLDLDGFKLLNDRFGHPAGDELLCDVATALARTMRAQDTVARIGGDEFCVLAPETDASHAVPLARRIADIVATASAGVEALRASVGIAVFPEDGTDPRGLFHAADHRLLNVKRQRPAARTRRRAA
jgi:diguanylate cyclase (GGDEF)-like protein